MSRAHVYKNTIMNRTAQSGGSVGGDMKAGLVRFSMYPSINMRMLVARAGPESCCGNSIFFGSDGDAGAGAGAGTGAGSGAGADEHDTGDLVML